MFSALSAVVIRLGRLIRAFMDLGIVGRLWLVLVLWLGGLGWVGKIGARAITRAFFIFNRDSLHAVTLVYAVPVYGRSLLSCIQVQL